MGKFLRNLKFLFDLFQRLARGDHFGDFVSHDEEVALLLFEVFDASTDMGRAMAGNISFYGQVARHDVIENLNPAFDVGIKNAGRLSLPGMNLGVQQIAHEHDAFLGDIDREIAGAVSTAFRRNLKGDAREVKRHRAVEADIGTNQFSSLISGVPWIVGIFPLVELFQLLHLKIVDLVLRGDVNGLVLAEVPGAGA